VSDDVNARQIKSKRFIPVILLFLLGSVFGGTGETLQLAADARSSGAGGAKASRNLVKEGADSYYSKSASAFFDSKAARKQIDLDDVDYELLSAAVFHETNQRRARHGKAILTHLPRLDSAATKHAKDMIERGYFSHFEPNSPNRRTPRDRIEQEGLSPRFSAENIATAFGIKYKSGAKVYLSRQTGKQKFSYSPGGPPIPAHTYRSFAESLLDQWMGSPGHRENILSEEPEFLGIGCSESKEESGLDQFYCVQLFMR
jgi:uncharacterized protein YkwD